MYLEHYGLSEPPFRITPHTEFFYQGANRGATLEALIYAIQHGEGLVKVIGEVGAGKTMLGRVLMERLPEHVDTVYLANPSLSRDEILRAIADDLHIDFKEGRSTVLIRALQDALVARFAAGRQVVVLIDEAHAMPEESLEEIRLLSNLDHGHSKLLQIVLFGQPELDDVLERQHMRQLRERITHSFQLAPLRQADVGEYLMFRMRTAGYKGPDVFAPVSIQKIAAESEGLTRRINILADKALISAFSENRHMVAPKDADAAIRDSGFRRKASAARPRLPLLAAAGLLLGGLLAGWGLSRIGHPPAPAPTAPPTTVRPVPAPPPVPPASRPAAAKAETVAMSLPPASAPPAESAAAAASGITPPAQLATRIADTLKRFETQPAQAISIQITTVPQESAQAVLAYLAMASRHVPEQELFVYQGRIGKTPAAFGVLYGIFQDRAAATQAVRALPAELRRDRPLLRTLGGVLEESDHPVLVDRPPGSPVGQ